MAETYFYTKKSLPPNMVDGHPHVLFIYECAMDGSVNTEWGADCLGKKNCVGIPVWWTTTPVRYFEREDWYDPAVKFAYTNAFNRLESQLFEVRNPIVMFRFGIGVKIALPDVFRRYIDNKITSFGEQHHLDF